MKRYGHEKLNQLNQHTHTRRASRSWSMTFHGPAQSERIVELERALDAAEGTCRSQEGQIAALTAVTH